MIVVGSLNYDAVAQVERPPRPGETVQAVAATLGPGGKGANQAIAAARLGADVALFGCVGSDALGDAVVDAVAREGVDVTGVRRSATRPTGLALITLDASGENTIVVATGANAEPWPSLPDVTDAAAVLV